MKIAVPVRDGKLCAHFGHCEHFAVVEADKETGKVLNTELLTPPPHEPGVLPQWLHEQGTEVIIAGGMGSRAQQFFTQFGMEVVVGASEASPEEVAVAYLQGELKCGDNVCDH